MRKLRIYILILTTCGLIFFTVFGKRGVLEYLSLKSELTALEHESSRIDKETFQAKKSINDLKTDQLALEAEARKRLGLGRPDEIIYVLPRNPVQPKDSTQN
ncbi:septum formation initiator family protein [bacterium]|nr:septum formation initiator family protein [bacterium]